VLLGNGAISYDAGMQNRTPRLAGIAAISLLVVSALYVGSYLMLVSPGSDGIFEYPYKYGNEWSARVYWPLEQIDRNVRQEAWKPIRLESQF
jgi:hypothetical protein